MKGGKDEEKIMGPLFPRLHVNDTEKGGPRAPPRNKMALYEQLSVPSQRLNSGSASTLFLQPHNAGTLVPSASLNQDLSNTCVNKLGNEVDLRVPTFAHSRFTPCSSKDHPNIDRECISPFSPSCSAATPGNTLPNATASTFSSSMQLQITYDKHLKRTNTTDLRSRQHIRKHSEENPKNSMISKYYVGKTAHITLIREKMGEPLKHSYGSQSQEYQSIPRNSPGNGHRQSNVYPEDEMQGSLQVGDVDINDDVSETSMVDSILGLDISPDDVVGVIGQKHFWKARKAIVHQQKLFAGQVFELHRLIKVQRLISGSPHLLLGDNSNLIRPPLKTSPHKKLPSVNILKSLPQIIKQKEDLHKPNLSTGCAAENAVRSSLFPSVSDGVNRALVNKQSSYGPYSGNPPPPPIAADNKASHFFHPPPGNQLLVPIMSPSEGLVYKPYLGPCPPATGFMTPIYGGCGPLSVSPVGGDFLNPAYGIPASHPQGIGVLPGAPLAQTYFPHGMPVMNPVMSSSAVQQVNTLAGAQSRGQAEQLSTREVNFNLHSRNSCNMSNQKSEAISCLQKFQTSKESELQGSTGSSPWERAQGEGAGNVSEARDALTLLPRAPAEQGPDQHPQTQSTNQQQYARVIKVVPHNRRSATESAARIFQSIQEGRQQYDSV